MELVADEVVIPSFVVCQNCMETKPFTIERHLGVENCNCGGDYCGCSECKLASLEFEIIKLLKPN